MKNRDGRKNRQEIKIIRDETGRVVVTATELRKHFSAYMDFVQQEDFYVSKRGKILTKFQSYERYLKEKTQGAEVGQFVLSTLKKLSEDKNCKVAVCRIGDFGDFIKWQFTKLYLRFVQGPIKGNFRILYYI